MADGETRDWADGIDSSDLVEGRIVAGELDGEPVVLVRHGGRVCALAGKCTHAGAPLADGIVADGTLRCPWHHARFDVATGEAVAAPAFAPLTRYAVEEVDGRVCVGKGITPAPAPKLEPRVDGDRIVIVGGGAAGHACAEMLGRLGAGGRVTLIGEEADAHYNRTACSKAYLAGKTGRDDTALPAPRDATMRLATCVTRIDREQCRVETHDGDTVEYDILVLATGSEAVAPSFEGAARDDVHVVRTIADADALIAAAESATRAVVVGSSYVGLEVAASLIGRGLSVTVVSDADLPLDKTAGPEVGAMVRDVHDAKGVGFRMGRSVTRWDGSVATLDDGSSVAGDLIVVGIGAQPRLTLAEAAGLVMASEEEGGGVRVDAMLRTFDPVIHAIGDIASVRDQRLGHPIRVEHWVVAQRMGQWLARHLTHEVEGGYADVPFFWSGHYDTSLRYVGHVDAPDDRRIDGDVGAEDFAVAFAEEGQPQALMTCGRDRLALEREVEWERAGGVPVVTQA